jgi:CheY-like chemotaxis protein
MYPSGVSKQDIMPTVLLLEDTEEIQRMYSFGLQQEGFKVTVSSTAGEALARIDEKAFDIIVVDLMLNGMSGLDFLIEGDVRVQYPFTKIVVFTNLDNPSIRARVESYGVDGYLTKSDYEPKQFAEYLKQLVKS